MSEFCFVCAVLIFLGAFYTFAGLVATRAALASYVLDWALAGISGKKPSRVEKVRTAWLIGAAFLVLAGGLSLFLRTEIAAWLFISSALGQALYIGVIAPRVFDVEDPPEPQGRRQTVNAFIIYVIVTAGVAWAGRSGHLTSFAATPLSHYVLIASLLFLHIAFVARQLLKLKATPVETRFDGGSDSPSDDLGS